MRLLLSTVNLLCVSVKKRFYRLCSVPYMASQAEPEVIDPEHLRVFGLLVRVMARVADHLAVFGQRQV